MNKNKKADAFENVKNQIGYCGIWCGSCIVGNGTLRKITEKYKNLTETYDLKDWGPKDIDFTQFYKWLESIQKMDLCAGCRKGGGREDCEMKACAKAKKLDNCTLCPEFEQCDNAEPLKHMRSGALAAGLEVLSQGQNTKEFIEQSSKELRNRWPCCILFMNDRAWYKIFNCSCFCGGEKNPAEVYRIPGLKYRRLLRGGDLIFHPERYCTGS